MIGLIIAEKDETANLVKTLKAKILEFNGCRYYIGNINDKQVIVCYCGVGKANAAATTMNMIINFNVDKIFNIGLAGACKANINPGAMLIASGVEYDDVDMTAFNYQLNQLPDLPVRYDVKSDYINYLKTIIETPVVGVIATGDSIISINNVEAFPSLVSKDVVGFDMEAAAIAQVCHKTNVDFFCVKVVSDNLSYDKTSREQYDTDFKTLAKKIEKICIKVLEEYTK